MTIFINLTIKGASNFQQQQQKKIENASFTT